MLNDTLVALGHGNIFKHTVIGCLYDAVSHVGSANRVQYFNERPQ